jgi:hypothetical protein
VTEEELQAAEEEAVALQQELYEEFREITTVTTEIMSMRFQ